ncbi:hypothetical protein [Cognaticolwellia beringensis]|uniref:Uncharacterized protein n=1 Tax=Cognaticolwellia beringensis TaxID=1967665 RepID=A0A222GC35_9GAMM|nr:hypothetical protein [Cognaticolwellia beringensis]ASP49455.1 hypothetical protein B5D82_17755 [Cognaticolwellia beringensis]
MESNFAVFLGWQCKCSKQDALTHLYDSKIYEMREMLGKYFLVGYHCTKLTEEEIDSILANGMELQNGASLVKRIEHLNDKCLISKTVSESLISNNKADDRYRKNMIWFCFFKPFLAGRTGIEGFLRYWGGEALYNSHDIGGDLSDVLLSIGIPCIVKAKVDISSLNNSYYPDSCMIRVFLKNKGHQLENSIDHEGFSTLNIEPTNILEVIKYPSDQFVELTKCNQWEYPLAL